MICPECRDGFIHEPVLEPIVLHYRGFSKEVGVVTHLMCSNCLHTSIDQSSCPVDVDYEMIIFKREVNKQLSIGEEL